MFSWSMNPPTRVLNQGVFVSLIVSSFFENTYMKGIPANFLIQKPPSHDFGSPFLARIAFFQGPCITGEFTIAGSVSC